MQLSPAFHRAMLRGDLGDGGTARPALCTAARYGKKHDDGEPPLLLVVALLLLWPSEGLNSSRPHGRGTAGVRQRGRGRDGLCGGLASPQQVNLNKATFQYAVRRVCSPEEEGGRLPSSSKSQALLCVRTAYFES